MRRVRMDRSDLFDNTVQDRVKAKCVTPTFCLHHIISRNESLMYGPKHCTMNSQSLSMLIVENTNVDWLWWESCLPYNSVFEKSLLSSHGWGTPVTRQGCTAFTSADLFWWFSLTQPKCVSRPPVSLMIETEWLKKTSICSFSNPTSWNLSLGKNQICIQRFMHRIFDFSLICKSKHWIRYWANKLQRFQMVVCSTCTWIFSSKRKTWWCIILWGKDLNTMEHMIPIWKLCFAIILNKQGAVGCKRNELWFVALWCSCHGCLFFLF